jgi:hypothetical protein
LHDEVSLAQLRLKVRRARQSDYSSEAEDYAARRLLCRDHGGPLPDNTVPFLWSPPFAEGGFGVELDALRLHQQIPAAQWQKLVKLTGNDGKDIELQWTKGVVANNFTEADFPVTANLQDTCYHLLREMLVSDEAFYDSMRTLGNFLQIPEAVPLTRNEGLLTWLQMAEDMADIDLSMTQVLRSHFCDGAGDDKFVHIFRQSLPMLQQLYRNYVLALSKNQKDIFSLINADPLLKKKTDSMSIASVMMLPAQQANFYSMFLGKLQDARLKGECLKTEVSHDLSGVNVDLAAMVQEIELASKDFTPLAELQHLFPKDQVLTPSRRIILDSYEMNDGAERRALNFTKKSKAFGTEHQHRFLVLCNDVLFCWDSQQSFWQGGKLDTVPLIDIEYVTPAGDDALGREFTIVLGDGTAYEFRDTKPDMGTTWARAIKQQMASMMASVEIKSLSPA